MIPIAHGQHVACQPQIQGVTTIVHTYLEAGFMWSPACQPQWSFRCQWTHDVGVLLFGSFDVQSHPNQTR
jgi:hypothetical protein